MAGRGGGIKPMQHSFEESLAMSHAASDLPFWRTVYTKAFPTMAAMIDHRQDGEHQRAGIDRSIILANSKQILIDEKVRGRNKKTGKVYDDIALEYWSDEGRKTPGWVCKPLRADLIAYAIAPLGRCFLLPVIPLQRAWKQYGDEWRENFFEVRAVNKGYTTVSVGVPVDILFPAIGRQFRISFDPVEFED
jgi:hypothetical protein